MVLYRYSRWDGSQELFPIHENDVMEQLSEHLVNQGDISTALRSMTQKGVQGRYGQNLPGVQELMDKLRSQRQQDLNRYDLGSIMEDIKRQLDEVITQEHQGIDKRLNELGEKLKQDAQNIRSEADAINQELLKKMEQMAQRNREFLEQLPQDPGGAIRQLSDYEFMDPEAKAKFDQLLRTLQEQVLDSHMKNLSNRLENVTPEGQEKIKNLLKKMNQMLEERMQGKQPDFQKFMEQHGDLFGDQRPSSLEEMVEQMQRRQAQLQSLLKSLSPEMRKQLQELMDSSLTDQELQKEMTRLEANLEQIYPMGQMRREYPFQGEDSLSLEQAIQLMEHLQKLEELERQLKRTQHGASISEIDQELVEEVMGDENAQQLEQLKKLTDILEQGGYIRKIGSRFELTPKGLKKIGQKALQEIFSYIKRDRTGGHNTRRKGQGNEKSDETKRYEFGDPFYLDLHATLMNAVARQSAGAPVRLHPDDFEVFKTEQINLSSTVLMIDLSLSMAMRGNFIAAKKVALALDNLIRTQFPRDNLYIVGFSTYAREVKPEKLALLSWDEFDPYTNIQHGLMLSQKLLTRVSGGTRQIVMISDGEPTAHLESGQLFLQYPPSPRTIRETLREVKRCTSKGIVINTFMLDRSSYLVEFVDQMTRINRGRVFYTSADRLGQYLLVDYFASRRRVIS